MKVVYDAQIFALQEYGGISRYICALAERTSRFSDTQARIVAPLYVNRYLKMIDGNIAVGMGVPRLPKTGRLIAAANNMLFRPMAAACRPDIIHETYYSERATYPGRIPHVVTVYDMIHERFPDIFPAGDPVARYKAAAVYRADHVFCISEKTRQDLLEIHKLPEERVSVTHLGYDTLPASAISAGDLVGASPYLLYVGERRGYKNFAGLLRAFAASAWLKDNFRLVCFGGGGLSAGERRLIVELGLSDAGVRHVGGGDDCLAALYKGAAAFVYPSQYEGFGIPPLEAMSMACPVICSNTSSIPEVVGDAGEYFDPHDIEAIRAAVEKVLESAGLRAELIEKGRTRCRQFSWDRCAQASHEVYRRLAR